MDTSELAAKAQSWKESAEDLTSKARDWQRAASERARDTGRVIDEYVHENAWISLAVAAAIGCAIGLLLGRGRD